MVDPLVLVVASGLGSGVIAAAASIVTNQVDRRAQRQLWHQQASHEKQERESAHRTEVYVDALARYDESTHRLARLKELWLSFRDIEEFARQTQHYLEAAPDLRRAIGRAQLVGSMAVARALDAASSALDEVWDAVAADAEIMVEDEESALDDERLDAIHRASDRVDPTRARLVDTVREELGIEGRFLIRL